MAQPAIESITLWRGDTAPSVTWGFDDANGVPLNLAGSSFVLTVSWDRGKSFYERTMAVGGGLTVNLTTADVTWTLIPDDTGLIPQNSQAVYRLKRLVNGTVQTWVYGPLIIEDGEYY